MSGDTSPKLRIYQQDWDVCNVRDIARATPSSEMLGFETQMKDTSNWTGRINYFEVVESRLCLAKIAVNLTQEFENFIPENGGRQDITSRQWGNVLRGYARSATIELSETNTTFLLYKELFINYSGVLVCGMDLDHELYFHGGYQTANRYRKRVILTFNKGVLDPDSIRYEKGASYDDGRPKL